MMHNHVLVLLRAEGLNASLVREAEGLCHSYGARLGEARFLHPQHALEWPLALTGGFALNNTLKSWAEHWHIDINIVPTAERRKKLLVADMESTLIQQEMLDELGDAVGKRAEIAAVTERAMRGELDFAEALNARLALLKGLATSALEEMKSRITLMPGAATLCRTMKAHGAKLWLATSGFDVFAGDVLKTLHMDELRCNRLALENGVLTGKALPPISGRAEKKAALMEACAIYGLQPEQALALGDGANDLDLLTATPMGVAYHAKPAVKAAAPLALTCFDLSGALYLQGYDFNEFLN